MHEGKLLDSCLLSVCVISIFQATIANKELKRVRKQLADAKEGIAAAVAEARGEGTRAADALRGQLAGVMEEKRVALAQAQSANNEVGQQWCRMQCHDDLWSTMSGPSLLERHLLSMHAAAGD